MPGNILIYYTNIITPAIKDAADKLNEAGTSAEVWLLGIRRAAEDGYRIRSQLLGRTGYRPDPTKHHGPPGRTVPPQHMDRERFKNCVFVILNKYGQTHDPVKNAKDLFDEWYDHLLASNFVTSDANIISPFAHFLLALATEQSGTQVGDRPQAHYFSRENGYMDGSSTRNNGF